MKRNRVPASIVIACVALSGCTTSFRRTNYQGATKPAPADCRVAFKQAYPANPDEVEVLGSVTASDSGFSVKCDEAYVLRRLRADACLIGADVVSLHDEKAPDFWSTCYRAKADLLRFRDREAANTVTSDARYDAEPLRARSEVTYDRLRDAAMTGALGGAIGATASAP